jgi:hypothetical protein
MLMIRMTPIELQRVGEFDKGSARQYGEATLDGQDFSGEVRSLVGAWK